MTEDWMGFRFHLPYEEEEWRLVFGTLEDLGFEEVDWCVMEREQDLARVEYYPCEPITARWDQLQKRTWSLPAEPGLEVKAVRDRAGDLAKSRTVLKIGSGWVYTSGDMRGMSFTWDDLLQMGPLTDATDELEEA